MVLDFKVNARLVVGMTINFFYTPTSDFFENILERSKTGNWGVVKLRFDSPPLNKQRTLAEVFTSEVLCRV